MWDGKVMWWKKKKDTTPTPTQETGLLFEAEVFDTEHKSLGSKLVVVPEYRPGRVSWASPRKATLGSYRVTYVKSHLTAIERSLEGQRLWVSEGGTITLDNLRFEIQSFDGYPGIADMEGPRVTVGTSNYFDSAKAFYDGEE